MALNKKTEFRGIAPKLDSNSKQYSNQSSYMHNRRDRAIMERLLRCTNKWVFTRLQGRITQVGKGRLQVRESDKKKN